MAEVSKEAFTAQHRHDTDFARSRDNTIRST